jgi:predicted P-loop ATPase
MGDYSTIPYNTQDNGSQLPEIAKAHKDPLTRMLEQIRQLKPEEVEDWASKNKRNIIRLEANDTPLWDALTKAGMPVKAMINFHDEVEKARYKLRVSIRITADLKRWGYNFWMNDLDDSIWNDNKRWTDDEHATLRLRARDNGYAQDKILSALDEAVLSVAGKNRRHPLREYLDGLEWDEEDHIKELAGYFKDAHEPITYALGYRRSAFHAFLLRWLVGAVAKIYGNADAARSNFVLVLAGAQDAGKSHFAKWLCPLPNYFIEGNINPDNKDCNLRRTRAWVWEISELGATTRRADVEALKSFITTAEVQERRPYARNDVIKPTTASYIGTVNPDGAGFLLDSTGNRRFAVVDMVAIDWDYAKKIDVAQVWAQAVHIYQCDPMAYRLTPEEVQVRTQNAEAHAAPDVFADTIAKLYTVDPAKAGSIGWSHTSSDILERLRTFGGISRGNDNAQAKALARALRQHWGITGRRSHGVTYYDGLAIKG